MSREVRRIAVDFDWPLRKVWQGYQMPAELGSLPCPDCENGCSPRAHHWYQLWYGYIPFKPEDNGSTPFTPETPEVRAFAERNVGNAPDFYGAGEWAIQREAQRLADHFNNGWLHHLNADDVAALVEAGRLHDLTHTWVKGDGWQPKNPPYVPTPDEVNRWSLQGFGHDSINQWVCVRARCAKEGVPYECQTCGGSAASWRSDEHKTAHEAWESTEPPEGEGWQVWETVSEGSPVTPVFATRDELVTHLCTDGQRVTLREGAMSRQEAEAFVGSGWAPSFIASPQTGVLEGALVAGAEETLTEIAELPEVQG